MAFGVTLGLLLNDLRFGVTLPSPFENKLATRLALICELVGTGAVYKKRGFGPAFVLFLAHGVRPRTTQQWPVCHLTAMGITHFLALDLVNNNEQKSR